MSQSLSPAISKKCAQKPIGEHEAKECDACNEALDSDDVASGILSVLDELEGSNDGDLGEPKSDVGFFEVGKADAHECSSCDGTMDTTDMNDVELSSAAGGEEIQVQVPHGLDDEHEEGEEERLLPSDVGDPKGGEREARGGEGRERVEPVRGSKEVGDDGVGVVQERDVDQQSGQEVCIPPVALGLVQVQEEEDALPPSSSSSPPLPVSAAMGDLPGGRRNVADGQAAEGGEEACSAAASDLEGFMQEVQGRINNRDFFKDPQSAGEGSDDDGGDTSPCRAGSCDRPCSTCSSHPSSFSSSSSFHGAEDCASARGAKERGEGAGESAAAARDGDLVGAETSEDECTTCCARRCRSGSRHWPGAPFMKAAVKKGREESVDPSDEGSGRKLFKYHGRTPEGFVRGHARLCLDGGRGRQVDELQAARQAYKISRENCFTDYDVTPHVRSMLRPNLFQHKHANDAKKAK